MRKFLSLGLSLEILFCYSVTSLAALLECDLTPLKGSEFVEPFHPRPVKFEQRILRSVTIELKDLDSLQPKWVGSTFTYDHRAPDSMGSQALFENNTQVLSLNEKGKVRFFFDYFGREAALGWDPLAVIHWNENGTYRVTRPAGWTLFLEANDPFHEDSFEISLKCVPKL